MQKLTENFSATHPLKILIAEDNVVNQKLAPRILNKLGYEPHIVVNGRNAVEASNRDLYDIVFMDVQMPELDGLEATRIIGHAIVRQPIIIAMTANATQGNRDECLQAGMNDYLSKPIKLDELVLLLEKWSRIIIAKA